MVKPCLKAAFCASALFLAFPTQGHAAMAVTDATAIAKATEQLNQLKEQIQTLNDMRDKVDDQLKSIGKFGKITLPILNAVKMGNQLKQDMQCLMPDWKELIPELKFDEQGFSICDKSRFYRDSLWVDPIKVGGKSVFTDPTTGAEQTTVDWQVMETARADVKRLRDAITYDAATNGLGQADMAIENTEQNSEAIDDLQATTDSAKTEREHQAATAQGMVVNARINNQRNQILAQLLKVTSAFVMQATVPIDKQEDPNKEGDQQ